MGTKEQTSGEVPPVPVMAHLADWTNQSKDNAEIVVAQHVQFPKASASPPVITVAKDQTAAPAAKAAKKIRRAFSIPRNPFRWSRKFKTTTLGTDNNSSAGGSNSAISSCVGGGRGRAGSIISLSSYEAICKDTNGVGGGGREVNDSDDGNATGNIKRDAIGKIVDRKLVNGKPVSRCNEHSNAAANPNRILRRSSFRKFLNRIAQHVSTSISVGANKNATVSVASATADRVPPIGNCQWPADQTPGVMGLKNHGNTCFMNAVLQCLSHTDILAEYFVLDQYKADLKRRNKINSRKFGTKGELTEQLANVLKALWTCKNESDHSTSFKAVVDRYGSQFRSSTQHDAQEFLFWLLDKVHEDLNTATKRRYKSVKNSYGRPDEVIAAETLANHIRCNNSFVQAVFQAQFRSSLTCPRCRKQSNTFDPFHCISVQLPQLMLQTVFVTVVYLQRQPHQVKLGVSVPVGSPIVALRDQLQADTGIQGKRMVLVDINKEGFTRVLYDSQPVATLCGIESIYCIEVPNVNIAPAPLTSDVVGGGRGTTMSTGNGNPNTANSATAEAGKVSDSGKTANINANVKISATESSTVAKENNIAATVTNDAAELLLLVASVHKRKTRIESNEKGSSAEFILERFGAPFSMLTARDCSYIDLQKRLLGEMASLLKPEVFSYGTPLKDMFEMRLQDPSADPDTYLQNVEHPLLTEMVDLALSVLSAEAGPPHIKLLLEWPEPEKHFIDLSDKVVEHESVAQLSDDGKRKTAADTSALTLEQCLEHYTKAETLSAEDAWRCPHCQQYLPVVKTLGLWSLPDILVVHFKRFRQHHEKGANAAKLTTMVKFPLNAFDMSPHLVRGCEDEESQRPMLSTASMDGTVHCRPSPWKKIRPGDSRSSTLSSRESRETRYDLYAVCYHQGDTLETGHYTAACKNPYDRQWYKFDDQRVSKVPDESIEEEIINNEAYMLFYQRRTGDATECSGSSSNSGDHWVSRIAPPPITAVEINPSEEKFVETNVEDHKDVVVTTVRMTQEESETKPLNQITPEADKKDVKAVNGEINQVVVNNQCRDNEETSAHIILDDVGAAGSKCDEPAKHETLNKILQGCLTTVTVKEPFVKNNAGENQIFVMDEDCQSYPQATLTATSNDVCAVINPHLSPSCATKAIATPINVVVSSTAATIAPVTTAVAAAIRTVLTNGLDAENTTTPLSFGLAETDSIGKTKISPQALNGTDTSAVTSICVKNTSTSSSSSSLSSHSSPHSLAVSVHGASSLQSKFNGFVNNSVATGTNYKEVLLPSALKHNSSSISAAVAAHTAHEFHLSHHQPWNGSRSSVSALDSGAQTTNHQHVHGLNLRHSFSTSSNCKLRECTETLSSMLRNSANTCSKDTLIFIDQQNHHHHHHSLIEDDDDSFMDSRSLWISPVTPHKLITVSPKN